MEKKTSKNIHAGHRGRVIENFLRAGNLNGFSDVQILEMVLFFAIPVRDTNEMAHKIIDKFKSIENVFSATPYEIMKRTKYSLKTACVISIMGRFCEMISRKEKVNIKTDYRIISDYAPKLLEMYAEDESFYNFSDLEILELFLYFCTPKGTENKVVYDLLEKFIMLRTIFQLSPAEIMKEYKCKVNMACFLAIPREIAKRYFSEKMAESSEQINSVERIIEHLKPYFKEQSKEYFYVVSLDKDMKEIKTICLSSGNEKSANVEINELMAEVLINNASYIFIGHNHPSGNVRPSAEDINITTAISVAMKSIKIKLLDHIIIGKDDYYSFAKNGLFGMQEVYDG